MGVEINPNLCAAATENFALNCITNADVVVADSGKFATQILRTKQYRLYPKVEKSATTADHAHTHSGSRQPTQLRPPEDSSREALCELVSEAPQTAAADPSGDSVAAEPRPVQEVQEREGNGDENREELSGETTADSTEEINVAPAADASTGDSERPKVLTDAQKARAIRKANVINATLAARNAARKAEPLYVFKFGTVLVDPPRCGLDTLTLSLVANYAHILYISCCPDSLMRDLAQVLFII